jgi:hypothetical protein
MLTVNPSPFPAIYDILKKWWYSCGTQIKMVSILGSNYIGFNI